jgi:hypothetical protein
MLKNVTAAEKLAMVAPKQSRGRQEAVPATTGNTPPEAPLPDPTWMNFAT